MRTNWFVAVCLLVLSGLFATSLLAQSTDYDTWGGNQQQFRQSPRGPLGVYVKLDVEDAISAYDLMMEPKPSVHTYLRNLYSSLLADRAISGITLAAHWDHIQLSDPFCIFERSCLGGIDGYDWSYLDDGFEEANSAHKPVQLIITPGFDSPPWLLNKLPSCDGLFAPVPSAPANCGKVDFTGFPEQQRADDCNLVTMFCALPLPWNSVYKEAWWDFLANLSFRYSRNPAFVSVAIAGPIAASDEIILPTTHNETALQLGGMEADDIWSSLINHSFPGISGYQNSDQVFIDQWEQTIHAYERIFSGVTLVLSPDAGQDLPEFAMQNKNPIVVHPDNTLWATDCNGPTPDNQPRSCEAKTEILSYFVKVDGPNGKSTQVGGLTAASAVALGDIGISGVKVLTSLWPPRSPSFLGGAEFDHPVSNQNGDDVGCPPLNSDCTTPKLKLTPEEAAYNVLTVFFYGTPAAPFYVGTPASAFYGGTPGPAPITYLEVPYVDVQYAEMNPCPKPPGTIAGNMSLQYLLDGASRDLFEIANHQVPSPPPTCN